VKLSTESVVRTQPEDVAALLASRACGTFYANLVPATRLHNLWVEAGDQTTGWHYASAIDCPADFPLEGEDVFNLILTYTKKVVKVSEICFRGFAEVEAEEEMVVPTPILYEEIEVLARRLAHIPDVEELKAREMRAGFAVWVVVNDASQETRYAIYDAEWELMRQFPGCVFDFHLIDREGMDLSSMVSFDEETLTVSIGRHDYAR